MKKFLVTTKSESGDEYQYFIEHTEKPTMEQLRKWLLENGSDVDKEEEYLYEIIQTVIEIPKKFQKL